MDYLKASACCKEFKVATTFKKHVVVYVERMTGHIETTDFNGNVEMFVMTGEQALLAADGQEYAEPDALARKIATELHQRAV